MADHVNRFRSIITRARELHRFALLASANAAVGGQAVMEGVMMRSPGHWAVAIRRSNGEIVTVHRVHRSFASRHPWARLPILRGVIALGESLSIGFRALSVSAHYAAEWEEDDGPEAEVIELPTERSGEPAESSADVAAAESPGASVAELPETEQVGNDANPDTIKTWQIVIAFVFAFGFSILLFKVMPAVITGFAGFDSKGWVFVLVESVLRIGVFIGYLALVGLMPDMKRVFQYHSAEHKSINAWEHGVALEPELVNEQNRIHVRCGTAFMLWVFVVAIAVFGAFAAWRQPGMVELIISRVVLLPLIAGISFEIIRFAGRHADNRLVRAVLAPGLWMQYLTTRECTPEQCEVAIVSLQEVLGREYPDASAEEALQAATGDEDEALRVMA